MEQYMCYVLFVIGLALIIKAGDCFVDAAVWVARATGIPNIIIGATLVSICTTLPETVVSSVSAVKGLSDMAFGNAFGSIAFNTTFILGLTFLVSHPPIHDRSGFVKNTIFLLLLLVLTNLVFCFAGEFSRLFGLLLLGILVLYMVFNVMTAKRGGEENKTEAVDKSARAAFRNIGMLLLGAAGITIGSNLLVTNGELIAKSLGVSELIIGLTITALGTSLPELVTAIQSMRKGAHDISVGNIIGADVLNILLVMGLSSTIRPIRLQSFESAVFSMAVCFVIGAVVLWFGLFEKKNFTRTNGVILLSIYVVYITINVMYFS